MCVSVSVRPSVASHISKTSEAIAIKFDTVTASITTMYHMQTTLTLTFVESHTDLTHENNKCSTISETVQAMPNKFAVNIVRRKVNLNFCQSDDVDLHSRSQTAS